jgi:hypothetical protein
MGPLKLYVVKGASTSKPGPVYKDGRCMEMIENCVVVWALVLVNVDCVAKELLL